MRAVGSSHFTLEPSLPHHKHRDSSAPPVKAVAYAFTLPRITSHPLHRHRQSFLTPAAAIAAHRAPSTPTTRSCCYRCRTPAPKPFGPANSFSYLLWILRLRLSKRRQKFSRPTSLPSTEGLHLPRSSTTTPDAPPVSFEPQLAGDQIPHLRSFWIF